MLPTTAAPQDFPATPRAVRLRESCVFVLLAIVLVSGLVFWLAAIGLNRNVFEIELLLRDRRLVQAEVVEKTVSSTRKNNHHIVYKAPTDYGVVSGQYTLSAEAWDKIELGQKVPIWYSPSDASVSWTYEPREQHLVDAKRNRAISLAGLGAVVLVILCVGYHHVSVEKGLASAGFPTLAEYTVKTNIANNRVEYDITWRFEDTSGTPRVVRTSASTLNKLLAPRMGHLTVLVSRDEWTNMRPWPFFRWVDILTDSSGKDRHDLQI